MKYCIKKVLKKDDWSLAQKQLVKSLLIKIYYCLNLIHDNNAPFELTYSKCSDVQLC